VTLSQATGTLVPQSTLQLTATVKDANGNPLSGRTLTWQSSASTVASVSNEGLVTGIGVGTATVTATSEGKNATANITVLEGAIIGKDGGVVVANGGNVKLTIPAGALTTSTPISVTPLPQPPSPAGVVPGTAYEFGPSGTTFAQPVKLEIKYQTADIDTNQVFYRISRLTDGAWVPLPGASAGGPTRTLTAETKSFSSYGAWTNLVPNSLVITPSNATVFYGQTLQLTATVLSQYATSFSGTPSSVYWSSNAQVQVSATGVATGVIPGGPFVITSIQTFAFPCQEPCYIGSYDAGTPKQIDIYVDSLTYSLTGSTEITVALRPVKSITLAGPSTSLAAGQKVTFVPTLMSEDGGTLSLDYRTVVWTSDNAAVASVTQTGEVAAIAPGSAKISIAVENVTASATVTVKPSNTDVASVHIEPVDGEVELGGAVILAAWPQDAGGTYLTGRVVTWKSNDASKVTVSAGGVATGAGLGQATITGTVEGVDGGAFLTVVPPYPLVPGTPSAGLDHGCLLGTNGKAWCWGGGSYGQRGDGSTTSNQPTPQPVAGGFTFTALSAGGRRTCALDASGHAFCWGENQYGQLGDNSTTDKTTPVSVAGGHAFAKIYAGKLGGPGNLPTFSCGLDGGGVAWCWGHGSFGDAQPTKTQSAPVQVVNVPAFTEIALGTTTACGLTAGGQVWCFGKNDAPMQVPNSPSFVALSGGYDHSCGLDGAGSIWCWGTNIYGQLGDGSTVTRSTPVRVSSSLHFTKVEAGINGTCALAEDQTAWCWGIYGRNGDGGPPRGASGRQDQSTPVPVQGGRHFTALSGLDFNCGQATDGTWCWGSLNFNGELGSKYRFNAPVKIRFPQ
jgi:uncharacterized protein YjdB/alpha-tubulin suppressor-like RCC1 family protein